MVPHSEINSQLLQLGLLLGIVSMLFIGFTSFGNKTLSLSVLSIVGWLRT
jgi:hypothetical protein